MRKYLLLAGLMFGLNVLANGLPKSCFGDYAGMKAAYVVIKNDQELRVEEHDVKVSISETEIIYSTGTITVKGDYDFFKQSKTEYLIKAKFSNGKSLSYEMDFLWNKKDRSIHITGTNGEPDVDLEQLDA